MKKNENEYEIKLIIRQTGVNKITMCKYICRMDYVGLNYYVSWQPG